MAILTTSVQLFRGGHSHVAALVAMLAGVSAAHAETALYLPDDSPVPHYFSGTNSRVHAYGHVTNGTLGITHVRVWIGPGDPIIDEEIPPEPIPYVYDIQLRIMFDSTRFDDGAQVQVTVELTDSDEHVNSQTMTVPVYNKVSLFGRHDMDVQPLYWENGQYVFRGQECYGVPTVEAYFRPLGDLNYHRARVNTTLGWDKYAMLPGVGDSNVFYVHTHGDETSFWTDKNDYHFAYPNPPTIAPENAYALTVPSGDLHGFALKPTRIAANGSGLPPFNSTGIPPVNLAFLDTCGAGTDNDFAEALLYPGGNFYTGYSWYPECQSEVGYAMTKMSDQTRACNEAFWERLEAGYTVHEARLKAYEAYKGDNKPASHIDFMHVWGDFYTRLKGVYSGSIEPSPQPNWWRIE
jgi:hypothetical protein